MMGLVVKRAGPQYPEGAKRARADVVVVQSAIGRDGRVIDARAIGGPAERQDAAVDSVRQYVFLMFPIQGDQGGVHDAATERRPCLPTCLRIVSWTQEIHPHGMRKQRL